MCFKVLKFCKSAFLYNEVRWLYDSKLTRMGVTGSELEVKTCFFYEATTLHKELLHQGLVFFLKICIHTSMYGPITSGARAYPTSEVCSPPPLVVITGCIKFKSTILG